MLKLLDAFKAFMTDTTTLVTVNSDRYTRHLALLAFMMTSLGTVYFEAEKAVKHRV
ncbi:MAG: hypothetical protein ABEJ99_01535 [Candidatus Nanohaloarchaea archaeon]